MYLLLLYLLGISLTLLLLIFRLMFSSNWHISTNSVFITFISSFRICTLLVVRLPSFGTYSVDMLGPASTPNFACLIPVFPRFHSSCDLKKQIWRRLIAWERSFESRWMHDGFGEICKMFYDRMTVHRDKFLVNKTNRRTEFQIYFYYDCTCFG